MEAGRVGERRSGILPTSSEGGSVGESSEGSRFLLLLALSVFLTGDTGDRALAGDLVRALFCGFGDFTLDEAEIAS